MFNQTILKHSKQERIFLKSCVHILDLAVNKIKRQGDGCSIPDTGAAYLSRGKRDAIAILVPPGMFRSGFREISDDSMKYLVTAIAQRHQVDLTVGNHRIRFVNFLQTLQDHHDAAFDDYNVYHKNTNQTRMEYFINVTATMREKLQHQISLRNATN